MTKTIATFLILLAAVAILAIAADVSGKWIAQIPGRDGSTRETTFVFKAEGDKLTGTMAGPQGEPTAISEGKITGDAISFVVTMERGGNTMKFTYSGTVAGDEIKMKREGGQGQAREFAAKRAK